jgi:spermidine synthase
VAAQLYARSAVLVGTEVSAVYSLNTLGGIAGALMAGFILIPAMGSRATLIIGAMISATAGVFVTMRSVFDRGAALRCTIAVLLIPAVYWFPAWNPELMASGAYKYAPYLSKLDLESVLTGGDLLYFKEGAASTVSARKYRGRISLSVDGKVDATDAGDMLTQKMLAHLPLLLNGDAQAVALIGLGSGVTAGAALVHPIRKLDIIEISPEVVEASRFFAHVNHNALMDPRTELIIGDGRNHLRYARRTYDILISEPSNPWMAGMAALFTQEFFKEARSRLSRQGIFCQWVHSYNMSSDDLRTIAGTFRTAFPHAMLWTLTENDFLLLGSAEPAVIDRNRLERNFARAADDLREIRVQDLYSILSLLMLRDAELDRFAAGARLNTDDLPILEFRAPRFVHSDTTAQNFAAITEAAVRAETGGTAENHIHKAEMYLAAEALGQARKEFQIALRGDTRDPRIWNGLIETARSGFGRAELRSFLEDMLTTAPNPASRLAAADFYSQEGNAVRAIELLDAILREVPNHVEALEKTAAALSSRPGPRLEEIAARLLALQPGNPKGLFHLATARFYQGRLDEAMDLARRALEREPQNVRARNLLAIAYGQTFQPHLAEAEFQRAILHSPEDATSYNNYGVFLLDRARLREARLQFQRAISANPEDAQGFAGMGETFRQEGDLKQARKWYRRALQIDPNQPVAKLYGG